MKHISILVAAYRAEDWLEDCLSSVLAQLLPDGWGMQLLLGIDGCSATLTRIRSLRCQEAEVLFLKQNYGTYITFNTLMRLAQGELICRFDADDVMQAGYLAEQISAIESDCDVTTAWSIYTDAKLRPTSYVMAHERYHPKGGLNRRGTEGQFIIRREVWNHLGGFFPWRCGADTELFNRIRVAGFRHRVIERFLYLRRTHQRSLTVDAGTNFRSPYRRRIQRLTDAYSKQYEAGVRDVKINPTIARDCINVEIADHA